MLTHFPTVVESDPKASFSIAATARCTGECYTFPSISPLTLDTYKEENVCFIAVSNFLVGWAENFQHKLRIISLIALKFRVCYNVKTAFLPSVALRNFIQSVSEVPPTFETDFIVVQLSSAIGFTSFI